MGVSNLPIWLFDCLVVFKSFIKYFLTKQIEKERRNLPVKIGDGLIMVSYRLGDNKTLISEVKVDEDVFDMDVLDVYGKEMAKKLKEEQSIRTIIDDRKFGSPHIVYHFVGESTGREYDLKIN